MSKNRLKLLIWLMLTALALAAVVGSILLLGQVVTYFGTGADPRSALNLIPAAPPDLDERLAWRPDAAAGRDIEPFVRQQVAGAYLRAWAQFNISHAVGQPYGLKSYFTGVALDGVSATIAQAAAAGWRIEQADLAHDLELTFYAENGQVVAFTDHNLPLVQRLTHADGREQVIETRATFDVVMTLKDGNWRVRTWLRRPATEPPQLTQLPPQSALRAPQIVSIQGDGLTLNGAPFAVNGVNYYPQQTPWDDFWIKYNPDQTRADLAIARALGLNSVTIFVPFEQFGGDAPLYLYTSRLRHFLDEAERQGVQVIVTLFDHRTDHSLATWPADDRHIAALVGGLAGHPAILAWNLKNEPDRDYAANSPALVQGWLRHVAGQVRRHDPDRLITIGWSSPQAAAALVDVVDVVSFHYFAPAADYPAQLAELRDIAGGKPLLLGEFGLPTWNSFFPNGHTEAEQAAYYADLLTVQRLARTAGQMSWTLYDFAAVPTSEFRWPWQRGPQASMGVIRLDNTLKPAAALLAPGSDLTSVPAVPGWARFLKPFWLMLFAGAGLLVALVLLSFNRRLRRTWRGLRQIDWRRWRTVRLVPVRWQLLGTRRAARPVMSLPGPVGALARLPVIDRTSRLGRLWHRLSHYLPWRVAGRGLRALWRRVEARLQARRVARKAARAAEKERAAAPLQPLSADDMRELVRTEMRRALNNGLRDVIIEEIKSSVSDTPRAAPADAAGDSEAVEPRSEPPGSTPNR